jgi:hypothetical protein
MRIIWAYCLCQNFVIKLVLFQCKNQLQIIYLKITSFDLIYEVLDLRGFGLRSVTCEILICALPADPPTLKFLYVSKRNFFSK